MMTKQDERQASNKVDWDEVRRRVAAVGEALERLEESSPEAGAGTQRVQRLLARRAERLARVPVAEEAGERLDLVMLRLGSELYALDASFVSNIRPLEQLTPVPRVPAWVAGLANIGGQIVSVLDLPRFLGLPVAADRRPAYLIVVETPKMQVGLLVDEVLAAEPFPANRLQVSSEVTRGLPGEYVRGVGEWTRRAPVGTGAASAPLIVVLDLVALLEDPRLIVQEEIA